MAEQQSGEPFASWADLQIMGRVHHIGYVSEVELCGAKFLKVEPISPMDGTPEATIYYRPESVYSLQPTTEEAIRADIETMRERAARRQQLLTAPPSIEVSWEGTGDDDPDLDEDDPEESE